MLSCWTILIALIYSSRLTRPWRRMQWERAFCPLLALSLETIAVAKSLFDVSRHFSPRPLQPREIQFSLSFLSKERDWIFWRNLCIFIENQVNYMRVNTRTHTHRRMTSVFSHARSVYPFLSHRIFLSFFPRDTDRYDDLKWNEESH